MQQQYSLLVFLVLVLAIVQPTTTTITINYFGTIPQIGNPNETFITDTSIALWVNVSACPLAECSCRVKINETDGWNPVHFESLPPGIGFVYLTNLKPYTLYSFTLNCDGADENVTREYRTDVGKPSSPRDFTITLNSTSLFFTWLPPLNSSGPDYQYYLKIDDGLFNVTLPSTTISYQMTVDYPPGSYHTVIMQACATNRLNQTECSDVVFKSFIMPQTTPVTFPMTTITRSTGILSYPACLFVPIFLLIFVQMI